MNGKADKLSTGWQIKGWADWVFTIFSFVAFLSLEGALLYAYYIFLSSYR